MNALIFSGFLAVQPPTVGYADPTQEAWRHLRKAMYYHLELNKTAELVEKRYIPQQIKVYAPYLGVPIRIITEKKLSYTWTF